MSGIDEWRGLYRALGFVTIPLRPRQKRPLMRGWLAGPDQHWKDAPPDANVGILTGAPSGGLVVLDFDTRDGPERVLGLTPAQLSILTIVVETARGWHVYARESGRSTCTLCEGLDVRAEGAMVVAPPSIHPSGVAYRLVGSARELIALAALLPPEPGEPTAQEVRSSAERSVIPPDLVEAEAWIAVQSPKLQAAWRRLREPPSYSFDASKADFAIARCLWEAGYEPESVARLLLSLPGSRARERGEDYALRTAHRAAALPSRGRLDPR